MQTVMLVQIGIYITTFIVPLGTLEKSFCNKKSLQQSLFKSNVHTPSNPSTRQIKIFGAPSTQKTNYLIFRKQLFAYF